MQVLNSLDQHKSAGSVGQLPEFCGSTTDGPTTAYSADMHARGRKELQKLICYQQITGLQTFAKVAVFTCLERFSLSARISGVPPITRNRPSDAGSRGFSSLPAMGVRQPQVRFLNQRPRSRSLLSRDRRGIVCAKTCVMHWCTILRIREWG